jgi:hypothetical protein
MGKESYISIGCLRIIVIISARIIIKLTTIEKSKKHQLNEFKMNLLNELYPSSKVQYLTSNRHEFTNDRVIEFKAPRIINRDKSNSSLLSTHSSPSKNNSRVEREMDKKSKNILKRNIVSRYRNSPYISQVIK